MKIIIVRHADPDYPNNSLTIDGFKEADLLAERLSKIKIDKIYCSPLNRTLFTCDAYLKKSGRTDRNICDWLVEFDAKPLTEKGIASAWDLHPRVINNNEEFYDLNKWADSSIYIEQHDLKEKYFNVINHFDEVLKENGYQRNGTIYHSENGNDKTLIFFCHFGVEIVLLSHLLNIPPTSLWQGTIALPSSVTLLISEEREKSFVSFRMQYFGDISHLYKNDKEPSFAGRFTEIYEDFDSRH